jgi:protein tyrosine phosphatase (PTP) superfamily phosphohydrolase (DUF442 family)
MFGIIVGRRFEEAIESLPKPLLISCKSNRRAGLVYAVYKVSIAINKAIFMLKKSLIRL